MNSDLVYKIYYYLRFKGRNLLNGKKEKAIGLVVTSFDKGGLEQVVLNLYKQYKKAGYRAYILVQENNVGELAEYLDDPRDLFIFNNNWRLLLKFCLDKNVWYLHYHYNVYGLKYMKKLGIETIYTIHNVYTWLNDKELNERFNLIQQVDHCVAVSSFVKNYFCTRTQWTPSNVKVIINGIDFSELDGNKCSLNEQQFGINSLDILFVNIASFHRVKHQAVLIGAMKEVIKHRDDVKILLVGNIGDEAYYKEIQKRIDDNNLSKYIIHIPYINRKEIGDFLKNIADVMILPSLQEGCSNAVLEALYCGLPMILSKVGNAEDIKNLAAVKIVDTAYNDILDLSFEEIDTLSKDEKTKNVSCLADTILETANNIDQFKKEGVEKAVNAEIFTASMMAKQYLELIQDK